MRYRSIYVVSGYGVYTFLLEGVMILSGDSKQEVHGRLIQQKAGSGLTAVLATEKQFFVCASKIELFLPIIRISDVSSWVAATKAMRLALFTSSNASQFAPCKKFV